MVAFALIGAMLVAGALVGGVGAMMLFPPSSTDVYVETGPGSQYGGGGGGDIMSYLPYIIVGIVLIIIVWFLFFRKRK